MANNMRYRNFACVIYLDSCPENWLQIIEELKLPIFISPYHDKDKNADNTPKKPHYHVMLMCEGKKSQEQIKEIFEQFGGVGCEIVNSARSYARYLCHLDNPDKVRYSTSEVKAFGGLNYNTIIGTMADRNTTIRQMITHININDVISFYELVLYSEKHEPEWFDCLLNSGSFFIKEYIKSRAWRIHQYRECDNKDNKESEDKE